MLMRGPLSDVAVAKERLIAAAKATVSGSVAVDCKQTTLLIQGSPLFEEITENPDVRLLYIVSNCTIIFLDFNLLKNRI